MTLDPAALGMQPHPEGGWYRETWRHDEHVDTPRGPRHLATCVSFLLQPGEMSAWHRVRSAELWLWQGGGPVVVTTGGSGDAPAVEREHQLHVGGQHVVRPDEWQTARPAGDEATLVACVVSPGFDFADFALHDAPLPDDATLPNPAPLDDKPLDATLPNSAPLDDAPLDAMLLNPTLPNPAPCNDTPRDDRRAGR